MFQTTNQQLQEVWGFSITCPLNCLKPIQWWTKGTSVSFTSTKLRERASLEVLQRPRAIRTTWAVSPHGAKKRGQGDGQIQLEKRFRGSSQLSQHDLHLHEIDWHRLTIPLVSANLWQFFWEKNQSSWWFITVYHEFPYSNGYVGISSIFKHTHLLGAELLHRDLTWRQGTRWRPEKWGQNTWRAGPCLAIWQWKLAVSSDSYASYALFMVHVHCASYMFIKPWGTFHIPKLDCWREWFRWKIICWIRPTADQNWHCLVHHMGLSKRVCDHFDGWNMLKLWNGHFFRIWWP